jgi:DNA-binding MarR family transcriptional regulator
LAGVFFTPRIAVFLRLASVELYSMELMRYGGDMENERETWSLYPLFSELTRLETELWDAVDGRLREECGLPLSRFEPMMVVERLGACRVLEVSSALAITVGGTSKLIDRIEEAGYCRRQINPSDRRSSLIELTAAGKSLVKRAAEVVDVELDRRLGQALPKKDAQSLVQLLGRLRAASRSAEMVQPPG